MKRLFLCLAVLSLSVAQLTAAEKAPAKQKKQRPRHNRFGWLGEYSATTCRHLMGEGQALVVV